MSLADAKKALAMVQRAELKGRATSVTFTREIEGEYIPGGGSSSTTQEWQTLAVVLPVKSGVGENLDIGVRPDTLIESRLRYLLIPALSCEHEPLVADVVQLGKGATARVVGNTPLNPDLANPIIYKVVVAL